MNSSLSVPFIASPELTLTDKRILGLMQKLKSCPKSCLLQLHLGEHELPSASATHLNKLTTSLKRANEITINLNWRQPSIECTDRLAELLSYALSLARKVHGVKISGDERKSVGRVKRLLTVGVRTASALIKALRDTTSSEDESKETEIHESQMPVKTEAVQPLEAALVLKRGILNVTKKAGRKGLIKPLKSILKKAKNLSGSAVSSLINTTSTSTTEENGELIAPSKNVTSPEDLAESLDKLLHCRKHAFSKSMYAISEQLSKSSLCVANPPGSGGANSVYSPSNPKQISHKELSDGSVKFTFYTSRLTSVLEERRRNGHSLDLPNDSCSTNKTASLIKAGRLTLLVQNKEAICVSAKKFAEKIKLAIQHQEVGETPKCQLYRVMVDSKCYKTVDEIDSLSCPSAV